VPVTPREAEAYRKAEVGRLFRESDDDPDLVAALAATLVADHSGGAACVDRLDAVRASTREEVCRRLLRGRDYLLSYQDRRVSLSEAAREACLSPYHFHRAFVAAFATTPHQFIVEQRLLLAASMLAAGSRPVGDVCAYTVTSVSVLLKSPNASRS